MNTDIKSEMHHEMVVVDIGIDTHDEPVVYMRSDCPICLSEGFKASSRVLVTHSDNHIIATLNVSDSCLLKEGTIGLSKIALKRLNANAHDLVNVKYAPVLPSLSLVRKKLFGKSLTEKEFTLIMKDISQHNYSDIEITCFLAACAGKKMSNREVVALTKSMVKCGKTITWDERKVVLDKHCIGGLAGNRTTPIVVSIVSAAGYLIPKTSSRAITSPAGTADTMDVLTNVDLTLSEMKDVALEVGGCLAWGGAVNLSPADDLLIRIERALDIDGEGQLIASVLSKKIAAGSTHVLIDIPVGETAKVRTWDDAKKLARMFEKVGHTCGLTIRCVLTVGARPIGKGIGPAEEAKDILSVLNQDIHAPIDLQERSLFLAANLIDLVENDGFDKAYSKVKRILESGEAKQQFTKIINRQGGELKRIPIAKYSHSEICATPLTVKRIDNRKISRLAKLAGAPFSPGAGLRIHSTVGHRVKAGDKLFSLFAHTKGELEYALEYYNNNKDMIEVDRHE